MAYILVQQENGESDSSSLSARVHMWTATEQQMRWQNFIPSWKTRKSYIGLHHLADSQHSHPLHTEQKQGFAKDQNLALWEQVVPKSSCGQRHWAPLACSGFSQKSKLSFNCAKPWDSICQPLGSCCSTRGFNSVQLQSSLCWLLFILLS